MSNRGTDWARTRRFGSAARKAIAYVLGDHHNGETGRLDPAVETIAREADLSERATQINLREMERLGAIMVLRTPGRRCCTYVLNWDWRGIDGCAKPTTRRPANPAYDCAKAPSNPAPDSPKPEREDSTGKEERGTRARASAPLASSSGEILVAKEGKRPSADSPRKTPLPDDWAPAAEDRQLCIEAGFDPAEVVEEMADWARSEAATSADWAARFRRWVRRERKFTGQRQQSSRPRTAADAIAERYFGRGRAGA